MKIGDFLQKLHKKIRFRLNETGYTCDHCGAEVFSYPKERLCLACEEKLEKNDGFACKKCGRKTATEGVCLTCKSALPSFSVGYSPFIYRGETALLVNRMKNSTPRLACYFGEKMADSQCYNRFKKIRLIIYFLIVAASTYAMYVNFTGVPTAKTNIIGVNYIIYYGLPLLLAPYSKHSTNKKSSRYSTVALFMLWIGLAIFSFKRTTLIAVVGGVLIYLYKKYFANKKMKNKFLFLLILLVLVAVAMVVNNYTNGYIIERLNDVQETGGNGRVEIWSLVINLYSKSSFVEKLFGNGGLDAVNAMIGVSAHNEFLEILYDYGIFGVFFVGIALTALLLELFSKKVRKSNYAPLVWTTLVILCVLAMFSHIFLYPFVSIPVFFFLGNLYSACKGISETADTLYKIYSDDVF